MNWLNPFKALILRFFKVPLEPKDPIGDPASLRSFRPAENYFLYRLVFWGGAKLIGLSVTLGVTVMILGGLSALSSFIGMSAVIALEVLVCALALAYYLTDVALSFILARLEYETRWYKVTDRSLRIREGVTKVQELTMMIANIQNLSISQNPLQRLLGIEDLRVESAGGGGVGVSLPEAGANVENAGTHVAFFRGVNNAEEIRDLLTERLKRVKSSGLGGEEDAEENTEAIAFAAASPAENNELAAALGSILEESRLLRAAAEGVKPEA